MCFGCILHFYINSCDCLSFIFVVVVVELLKRVLCFGFVYSDNNDNNKNNLLACFLCTI